MTMTSIYPDKQMHAHTICAVSITHSVTQSLPVEGEGVTILTLCAFLENWCLLHYTTVDHQYVNSKGHVLTTTCNFKGVEPLGQ